MKLHARSRWPYSNLHVLPALALAAAACSSPERCGPTHAVVNRVIDGDTVELASGEKVRYLLVDTPEITNGHEDCYGAEARDYNRSLVERRVVELSYDEPCSDRYGRLLAYVSVAGREVNSLLVQNGFACVLHIPPAGDARAAAFNELQREAKSEARGLWAACESKPCG
jgi:micrococcal nuclease